ncbi:required for meiotic nuclear division protein 1 homolog [Oscarella lobularis]|uniref:required for meiotic nuclear division protein 1 homolog n=1 Tax=Oscarella lobularis TaxID=121494 RepID=UPI003313E826
MVSWNLSKPQLVEARKIIAAAQLHPYANSLVERENEEFSYSYERANSQLANGQIVLKEDTDQKNQRLERLAFSNAMALSVKLAMWECALDEFIESINWVPQSLKEGQLRKLSRKNVLQKTGTLVALSHEINLRSDLLENPDFYWDRPQLEELYSQTCKHLDVHFRTRVVNKKLDHCSDLVELLRTQLNERHSHRLEWLIICLIGTEIVLDLVGYLN